MTLYYVLRYFSEHRQIRHCGTWYRVESEDGPLFVLCVDGRSFESERYPLLQEKHALSLAQLHVYLHVVAPNKPMQKIDNELAEPRKRYALFDKRPVDGVLDISGVWELRNAGAKGVFVYRWNDPGERKPDRLKSKTLYTAEELEEEINRRRRDYLGDDPVDGPQKSLVRRLLGV